MSKLEQVFARARQDNARVFFPELVFGHPSVNLSLQAMTYLSTLPNTVLKVPTPAWENHPSNTSAPIIKAHQRAILEGFHADRVVEALGAYHPNFLVVYSDAVHDGVESFLERCRGRVDGLIFVEGLAGKEVALVENGVCPVETLRLSRKYEVDIARIVYTGHEDTFEEPVTNASGLIYLALNDAPDGPIRALPKIRKAVERIKSIRDIPVMAGFGISSPEDARAIASIEGIDGVTVGSWLFRALDEGFNSFKAAVNGISSALRT